MADRLRVTELDFDTIKTNLKNFLKQQSQFTDYDFEGAGLNVLLDILAYNTHYNAYYLNMVANEAFLDTALLRDSVVSHAKTLGYVPYSVTSPRAVINFEAKSSSNTRSSLSIPKGYQFLSNQIDGKAYTFVVLDDITVTKANSSFYFDNLEIYEGQFVTYRFVYSQSENPKQVFVLPEPNIDTSTLKISVSPSSTSTAITPYNRVSNILDLTTDSKVYFLQEGRNNKYEVYFGNNLVGEQLPDGAVVYASYLVTNGSVANKANNFVASAALSDSLSESLTNFVVTPVSAAAGGSDRESVDSIKFSASTQYATQNRLVTTSDYESFIKTNYPSIESISVWGGQDNIPPVYGKVYISLKPKNDYFISAAEKQRIIEDIVNPKNIVSISAEIVDPEYLYLLVNVDVRYDPRKTLSGSEALKNSVRNAIVSYRNKNLNKFASKLIDSKLEYEIDSVDFNAIVGNEVTIRAQKRITPTLNSKQTYILDFNVPLHRGGVSNKLKSTEFSVFDNTGTQRTVTIEEIPESYTGLSEIKVLDPGFNYSSVPTVTITGDGMGAKAVAIVENGKIKSIEITDRGYDYSRAVVTIGGPGQGASAVAVLQNKVGTLRTVYFDNNAERKIVNPNIGTINYETGQVKITDLQVLSVSSADGLIRVDAETQEGIIESVRNTIITIDDLDPNSIQIDLRSA